MFNKVAGFIKKRLNKSSSSEDQKLIDSRHVWPSAPVDGSVMNRSPVRPQLVLTTSVDAPVNVDGSVQYRKESNSSLCNIERRSSLTMRNSLLSLSDISQMNNRKKDLKLDLPIQSPLSPALVNGSGSRSAPVETPGSYMHFVQDLFSVMREATRDLPNSMSNSSGLNGSDKTNDGNSAQRYELIYVGKIRASHRKPPASFIDDAVDKFRALELEKLKQFEESGYEERQRHGSTSSTISLPPNLDPIVSIRENEHEEDVDELSEGMDDNSGCEIASSISTDSVNYTAQPQGVQLRKKDQHHDDRCHPRVNFNNNEVEKHSSTSKWPNSDSSVSSLSSSSSPGEIVPSANINRTTQRTRAQSIGGEYRRGRSGSISAGQNRTMVFQIGKTDVSLISLDKKSIIFHKSFQDILHCAQGIKHPEHFGFICPDANSENFLGYILRCQSELVAEEILTTLKHVFTTIASQQRKSLRNQFLMCETCPMLWLHKLCLDLEGMPSAKAHQVILRRLDSLTIEEKSEILTKLQGAEAVSTQEQNEIIMMLLRALCETKQSKHQHIDVHGKLENAGGGIFDRKGQPSVLDDLRKARRSLTSSFENIMKRKSKDDARNAFRERSNTIDADMTNVHDSSRCSTPESSPTLTADRKITLTDECSDDNIFRKRSSTTGGLRDNRRSDFPASKLGKHKSSPMMNIFMKVGNQSKHPDEEGMSTPTSKGSWRQAIFNRVVTPQRNPPIIALNTFSVKTSENSNSPVPSPVLVKRTPAALRTLWRKAILQQILLIRMEKENRKLKANQDAADVKRLKLSYEEITPCLKEITKVWEELLSAVHLTNRDDNEPPRKIEIQKLADAVSAGVPRQWRGDIWCLLAEQHCLMNGPGSFPDVNLDVTYEDLLKQLTCQQHAILIDLGRTFPSHPYFSVALGAGQLSLFNLLKAYSLLDTEVGYCQGLSFIAGVLLLHMEEEQAFEMLKHMLFVLGVRRQFKPDMVALQIQMYQLSRLIHDQHKDLYDHFEKHEIAATLYAAPWFLTLFASQFPLGFVARVFDLLFLYGIEVVFKIAVVLLGNHKELIIQCYSFETVMEFLKTTLPSMGIIQMERVFNQVFELDISKQLHAYEVEYHVLQEEMLSSPASSSAQSEDIERLEQTSRNLKRQNMELLEEVQMAYNNVRTLERTISSYQACNSKLDSRVKSLELEKAQLRQLVEELKKKWPSDQYDNCADILSSYLHLLRSDSPPPSNPIPYQSSSFSTHSVSSATVFRSDSPTRISNGSASCDRSQLSHSYGNPFRRRNVSGDSLESRTSNY
ncbi:ecotropic viral integration site, variant 3 [Chamberlinius hualienensis]